MNNTVAPSLVNEQLAKWTPLMRKLAAQFANTVASQDDLIQEGTIGLLKGLKTYDASKGTMRTYLFRCISNEIKSAAITASYSLNVPSGSIKLVPPDNNFRAGTLSEEIVCTIKS